MEKESTEFEAPVSNKKTLSISNISYRVHTQIFVLSTS